MRRPRLTKPEITQQLSKNVRKHQDEQSQGFDPEKFERFSERNSKLFDQEATFFGMFISIVVCIVGPFVLIRLFFWLLQQIF